LLAACGGRVAVPGAPPAPDALARANVLRTQSSTQHDLGRRRLDAPVRVVVVLNYNHQAELDRFVASLGTGGSRHRFLTRDAFAARYAPTAAQSRHVVSALRAGGLRVDRVFANRLVIDASGPSGAVERFFGTQIHDVAQGRYGTAYRSVQPVRAPSSIGALVHDVVINTVVSARPLIADDGASPAENVVENPGFESGKLAPWTSCGNARAAISKVKPHGGRYDALAGTTDAGAGEIDGTSAICQTVDVPEKAVLSVWLKGVANEQLGGDSFAFVGIAPSPGKKTQYLAKLVTSNGGWKAATYSLAAYANKRETLVFGVRGTGKKHVFDGLYIDDVSLTGVPSPSPSPSPTAPASATPSPSPSQSPKPSASPSATPVPTPTPVPTLGPPLAGPTYGPHDGWGPRGVADGFAFPVQSGYNGSGQTVAVVMDATPSPADLATYLQHYADTQYGTYSSEPVDGGGGADAEGTEEADLDVQTIAGLAPGANVVVYAIPALAPTYIVDAYNAILTDGKAAVVSSSFGGCESDDSGTNQVAEGAAATGITFAAGSGDWGSLCYLDGSTYPFGVNAPASDPYFVAVGGNNAAGFPVTNPQAWYDELGCECATGGGVSTEWTPRPSYQTSVPGTSSSGRNVPDIAYPANYTDIVYNGSWTSVSGTSWATPIYAAFAAQLNEVCGHSVWGITALYGDFAANGYSDFIDVTSENNQVSERNPGASYYTAATGYDNVSGIGLPTGAVATHVCSQ